MINGADFADFDSYFLPDEVLQVFCKDHHKIFDHLSKSSGIHEQVAPYNRGQLLYIQTAIVTIKAIYLKLDLIVFFINCLFFEKTELCLDFYPSAPCFYHAELLPLSFGGLNIIAFSTKC